MKGLALLVFLQNQHLQLPTPEALLSHDLPVPHSAESLLSKMVAKSCPLSSLCLPQHKPTWLSSLRMECVDNRTEKRPQHDFSGSAQ